MVRKRSGRGSLHKVHVKTGYFGEMVSDVKIAFYNDKDRRSREINLDKLPKSGSKQDETDRTFHVQLGRDFGNPVCVEIWREETLAADDNLIDDDDEWYCELIKIHCVKTRQTFLFPVNRWIIPGERIRLRENDMTLPRVPQRRRKKQQRKKHVTTKKYEVSQTVTLKEGQDEDELAFDFEEDEEISESYEDEIAYDFDEDDEVTSGRKRKLEFRRLLYEPVRHKETNMILVRACNMCKMSWSRLL